MGFNKRFVDKNIIKDFLVDKLTLQEIFNSDAIILMDNVATETFKLFQKKLDNNIIKNKIKEKYGY